MTFTLRMDELSRFRVSADLGSNDGRISLALKPAEEINPVPTFAAGLLIHFETVVENGCGRLHVFTSSEGGVTTPKSPAAFADIPNLAGMPFWFLCQRVWYITPKQVTLIFRLMLPSKTVSTASYYFIGGNGILTINSRRISTTFHGRLCTKSLPFWIQL